MAHLFSAVVAGDADLIARQNPPELMVTKDFGTTLLHCAASEGQVKIFRLLVERAPELLMVQARFGDMPLHYAAISGSVEIVDMLLVLGAQVDATDTQGKTALHKAIYGGHVETARRLLHAGAAVDVEDIHGRTLLHAAVDKADMLRLLLDVEWPQGRVPLDRTSRPDRQTALHMAIDSRRADCVEILLRHGVRVNVASRDGTELHHAVCGQWHASQLEIVRMVLDHGVDIEAGDGHLGSPALHDAVRYKRIDIVRVLLDRGAQVNAADWEGTTALHVALKPRHDRQAEVAFLLLERGAKDRANNAGETALQYAMYRHVPIELIRWIIDSGSPLDAAHVISGWTALHLAVDASLVAVVEMLLQKGASVDAPSKKGETALHLAIDRG
jgi:ankyrin repeat protein